MNKRILHIALSLIFALFLYSADAQVNKLGKKSVSFSSTGNKWNRIRQGRMFGVGSDVGNSAFVGLGYGASQYFGVSNVFMQQSLAYQISFLDNTIKHSIEVSLHNNYFGGLDISPMVWGGSLMFVNEDEYGQLFLRPEVGLAYPFKYRSRAAEEKRLTILLNYGYNFKLFERRDNLGVGPHYISLKFLFTIWTFKEMTFY